MDMAASKCDSPGFLQEKLRARGKAEHGSMSMISRRHSADAPFLALYGGIWMTYNDCPFGGFAVSLILIRTLKHHRNKLKEHTKYGTNRCMMIPFLYDLQLL